MSATEELRRLLDERGVEWGTNETLTDCWTRWEADKFRCTATEINGIFAFSVGNSTPEQAIAVTLGRGECEMEYVSDFMSWHCKACDMMDMAPHNPKPRYCKWCGAKVVE